MVDTNIYARGTIWWMTCGKNADDVSHVQKGFRPVVIVSNNTNNLCSDVVVVCPLTHRASNLPVHVKINMEGKSEPSYIMCEQMFATDKYELSSYTGVLNADAMNRVEEAIKLQLAL